MLTGLRKCLVFLTPAERWRWLALIPMAAATAVAEAVGAAVVFVLIKIIGHPSDITKLPLGQTFVALLPWQDDKSIVLAATIGVALFYLVKNIALGLIASAQAYVVSHSIAVMARRLLEGYLAMPLPFHLRRNSAELIRNTNDSVDMVCRLVLQPAVSMISEALIVFGIVVVLMATAPLVTLIALVVLLGLLLGLLALTQRAMGRWGAQEHDLRNRALRTLQQSLGGFKEVKIMGRERYFYDLFSAQQQQFVRLRHRFATVSYLPRLMVETVFICGVLLVVLLVTARGSTGPEIIPLLGLYAYAGFRVIPSVNRIMMYLNSMRYGSCAIDELYDDFLLFARTPSAVLEVADRPLPFTQAIALEHVAYRYDGAHAPVLQDVTLRIERGESIGIVGPTGAGKSTLVDIVLGLLQPTGGRVTVDGTDLGTAVRSWQRKIGYVPQAIYLMDDTIRRNVAFGLTDDVIDEAQVQTAVRMAQLHDFIAALPNGLDTVVGERGVRLSGGERQRVGIARALYHAPEVLVFDEATSALDVHTEREVTRAIEALHGRNTMLIIAHRLSTVRACDRLVFLRSGRVVDVGAFDELVARNAEFSRLAAAVDTASQPAS